MKKILITALLLAGFTATAQVKVGDNATTVNADALLEMESTNKGLLLPRVELTSTTSFAPLSAHVAGMYVYNTATAGDVVPGNYYNDGTKWIKLGEASPERNITRTVYVDTANPNTATLFSTGAYYPNRDCVAGTTPTSSFTTNANPALAGQTDAMYVAQTGCDDDEDYAEYSYWIWDGTAYITYTAPKSTPFYLEPGTVDAGSNKINAIRRDGSITAGNVNGLNAKSGAMLKAFHRNSDTNTFQWGLNTQVGGKLTTSRSVHIRGTYNQAVVNTEGTPTITGTIYGSSNLVLRNATATDAGTISAMGGYETTVGHNTATVTGTTTSVYGYLSGSAVRGGTITNLYDYYAGATTITGTGAVTNHYGLYIAGFPKRNFVEGNLGVGLVQTPSKFYVNRNATAGTISSVGTTVTGVGTLFTNRFIKGDNIVIADGNARTIASITSDTELILTSAFASDLPAGTAYNSVNSVFAGGNIGIDTSAPASKLDVNGVANFRKGSTSTTFTGTQLTFSFSGGTGYKHAIRTRHNGSALLGNAIDFYNWDHGVDAIHAEPTLFAMTINGGNVGVGTTNPTSKLTVAGDAAITSFTGTTKLGLNVRGAAAQDEYVGIDFNTQSGLGDNPKARIAVKTSSTGSYMQFGTTNSWAAGINNVAMTINPVGNIGLGTELPTQKLQIVAAYNNFGLYRDFDATIGAAGQNIQFGAKNGTALKVSAELQGIANFTGGTFNGRLRFATLRNDVMTTVMDITETGNVGIGTTTPTSKLQVVGLPVHADNATAVGAGLTAGAFYHNGDGVVRVVF